VGLHAKPTLWRNRDFLTFWSGETLSLFGEQVTILALPLTAVIALRSGPEQLGLLRFLQMMPYLLFGPLVGVWVDRHRRLPAMFGANLTRMILIGLVPVLAAAGRLDMPLLLVITFGVGSAALLYDVSWMSFVPDIVRDPGHLVEANARLGTSQSAATAAGPGLAGALVSLLTAPIAMAANAATYLASAMSLLLIRTTEERPRPAERPRLGRDLAEGLRFVAGNRYLRWAALVGGFCNFFISANQPIFILYAVRDRHFPASALGLVLSLGAAGGVLGALLAADLLRRLRPGYIYVASLTLAFGAPLLIPAATGSRALIAVEFTVAFFLSYLGVSVVNVVILSLRQTITPAALMGRMNAAMRAVMFGLGAFGGPAAGLAAVEIGVHGALWLSALGGAAFIATVFISPVSRLRTIPPSDRPAA
jgi:MFS family permease